MGFLLFNVQTLEKQQSVLAYSSQIDVRGAMFVLDISHEPFHDVLDNLYLNLSESGNAVVLNDAKFRLDSRADALFIPDPYTEFTTIEKQMIKDWFDQGDKLLFISGDSDYGGYFQPSHVNNLLTYLESHVRLDSTAIYDSVYNDDADFRVAAVTYGVTQTALIASEGCMAGIMMHAPCAILGYNDSKYVDLRNTTLPNVEVLLSYSENATSYDSDVSATDTDVYSLDNISAYENGNYPAVVYEKISTSGSSDSHLILAGEAIYSDYKNMYSQITENRFYNGNLQYGRMFVNNIINHFVESEYDANQITFVESDADFINYGFPGSGTQENPYIIEDYCYDGSGFFGIYISSTTKHVLIRNCTFFNMINGIGLEYFASNTVVIENNTIESNMIGVIVLESDSIIIKKNFIADCLEGIQLYSSQYAEIMNNTIRECLSYGVVLDRSTNSCEIHHNNFINNSYLLPEAESQAYDDGRDNRFHHNYYSDYNGKGDYAIDGEADNVDKEPNPSEIKTIKVNFLFISFLITLIAIPIIFLKRIRKQNLIH